MTVRELLSRCDSAELTEWEAMDRIDSFLQDSDQWRFGTFMSWFAEMHRDPKKRAKPFEPSDFERNQAPAEPKRQSPQEQQTLLTAFFKALAVAGKKGKKKK